MGKEDEIIRKDIERGAERLLEKEGKKTASPAKEPRSYMLMRSIIALIIVLVIIIIIVMLSVSFQPSTDNVVSKEVTIYADAPVKVSIEKYTNMTDRKYSETVSLVGYLKEEVVQTDAKTRRTTAYIVDDYGNKIKLFLGYYGLPQYDNLFVDNSTTTDTYNVSGTFRYANIEYRLDVVNITQQDGKYKR